MKGSIYSFLNTKNKKRYIGSSRDAEFRKQQHLKSKLNDDFHIDLRNNPDDFVFEILEDNIEYYDNNRKELNDKELYWIKYYDSVENGYNDSYVCDGVDFSDERKNNVRIALKTAMNDELRQKISEATRKAMKNPEIRKKCSKGMKGKTYVMDEARKKAISEGRKGITFSEEHRKHLSEARKGKSPSNKGIPMSNEEKLKISKAKKGKHRVYNPDGTYHYE